MAETKEQRLTKLREREQRLAQRVEELRWSTPRGFATYSDIRGQKALWDAENELNLVRQAIYETEREGTN